MKLTKEGRFAIRGVIDIAVSSKQGRAVRVDDIAERMMVSKLFLNKIFYRLTRAGILISVRGRNGGYLLGKKGLKINLFEILTGSGEILTPVICASSSEGSENCDLKADCLMAPVWEALYGQIKKILISYTVDDVVEGRIKAEGLFL